MNFIDILTRRRALRAVLCACSAALVLASCGGRQGSASEASWPEGIESASAAPDTLTFHATLLTIADCGRYVAVDIRNPWDSTAFLGRYALVHRDSLLPDELPDGVRVIRTPVSRAAVFSAVHTSALAELGVIDRLSAVADGRFFSPADTVSRLLAEGLVADVGPVNAPSVEAIVASGAEVVLESPMQGSSPALAALGNMPVAAVECADYMELSPIGRAEWILLLGELFGRREEARTIFSDVIDRYNEIAYKAAGAESPKPRVLTDMEYSGVWYLPAGGSYQARMLKDAGALWPWADTEGKGSLSLDLAAVLDKASDADVWLLRTFGYDVSAESMKRANPLYSRFKAFGSGEVYSCDSEKRPIFNDIAFHPERVLAEYVAIFHPELMPGYELRYFRKMSR